MQSPPSSARALLALLFSLSLAAGCSDDNDPNQPGDGSDGAPLDGTDGTPDGDEDGTPDGDQDGSSDGDQDGSPDGDGDAGMTDAGEPPLDAGSDAGSDTCTYDDTPGAPDPCDEEPVGRVECPATLSAPTQGICDAQAGTTGAVIVHGNVLAQTGEYINGSVLYNGDQILCVGCGCAEDPMAANATVVNCTGNVVSPGLINAHDHLNYNERSPLASTAAGGVRFEHRHGWRGNVSTPSNQHGTGATSAGMRWNELRQFLTGTTSIAASTKANGGLRNLDELEARDTALGFEATTYQVFALGDSNETFRDNCSWNYVYGEYQVSQFHGLVTHTSEGINDYAQQEFVCQSKSTDGARDFVEKNVGHIHGVGLHAADYFNMKRDGSKLVWSPRSNVSLYGNTAQAPIFDRMGGTIALGTDWTFSGSATMTREMACVAELNPAYGDHFTDQQIWLMATANAARATGSCTLIGSLKAGKIADIAVFRAQSEGQLHGAVINALTDDVGLVVRDGDLLYAETDVAEALGQTCDPIDVCGEERRVCTTREFGATFASIASAVSAAPAAYPAVFCDVPANEPTCVPSRPSEYTAPSADDSDGDGVPNATDNCPDVFNPIRPIDDGVQPDNDADGLGDMCDDAPLAIDLDGDMVPNEEDNCPFVSNDDQADVDCDHKGDACDPCPDTANADGACPPSAVSIVAIQNGSVPVSTSVLIEGAIVTARDGSGFMAQDPSVTDGKFAGIYVFTGSSPGVTVGQKVSAIGTVIEYFNLTELSDAQVLTRENGTPITPVTLTVAEAATEPYEGVLVTLSDVTSVVNPYSCAADGASCTDANLFSLNNSIVAWDRFYQDGAPSWTSEATAAATDGSPTVTGVMHYRFDRRRIVPRTAADITP